MDAAASLPSRTLVPRAERFPVRLPLRYRITEQVEWHEARIHNISGSGLLFETDDALNVGTRIEMAFPLEEAASVGSGAMVRCAGSVVRRVEGASGESCFGAAIEHYRLQRTT